MIIHKLRNALFFSAPFAGTLCLAGEPSVQLRISDQAAFSVLDESVKESFGNGASSVEVLIDSGVYYYHDRHLDLSGLSAEGKRLSVRGEGAVLYPAMEPADPEVFDVDATYYEERADSLVPVYAPEPMQRARFLVRVVSLRHKTCCLRISEELGDYAVRNGYIYITQWFRGRTYKITAVKGRSVYFHADDLYWIRLLFNVNLDFTFSLDWPRYRLVNCHEPDLSEGRRKALASTFLAISDSRMDSLSLSGLRFVGNRHDSQEEHDALIRMDGAQVPVRIGDCRFEHIRNDCIQIRNGGDMTVTGCVFDHCYRNCVMAADAVSDIVVEDNHAVSCGLCGDNVFVIRCCADRFRISGNTIEDYGYGGISTGLHYTMVKTTPIRGTIAGNEIFQTPDYFRQAPLNLLMDSGGIYVATQNDAVVIRDNYIHDLNGPTYNRGIFADDGASHLHIFHNRIERIATYNAIDIDPRSAWKMRWRRNRKVPHAEISVGNHVYGNDVDGRVRILTESGVKRSD